MRKRDDDLDDEIQSHLNMATQDRIARGESPSQARSAAVREFGNIGLVKETTKDHTMILTKVLGDYPDRITGPVQKFDPQLLMQQMQRGQQQP